MKGSAHTHRGNRGRCRVCMPSHDTHHAVLVDYDPPFAAPYLCTPVPGRSSCRAKSARIGTNEYTARVTYGELPGHEGDEEGDITAATLTVAGAALPGSATAHLQWRQISASRCEYVPRQR
jgi:hypothetical protein